MAPRADTRADVPAAELRFRFDSGRLCLAFVATVGERWRANFERLREPGDLARWLVLAGVLPEEPAITSGSLSRGRELREAIYRCARARLAGRGLPRPDVAQLNALAAAPTPVPQMVGGRIRWQAPEPGPAALSVLARDAIDLFTGPLAARLRECESSQCAALFLDSSRPGQRRWCSSATCGSRARSAAYRQRQR